MKQLLISIGVVNQLQGNQIRFQNIKLKGYYIFYDLYTVDPVLDPLPELRTLD